VTAIVQKAKTGEKSFLLLVEKTSYKRIPTKLMLVTSLKKKHRPFFRSDRPEKASDGLELSKILKPSTCFAAALKWLTPVDLTSPQKIL